VMRDGMVERIGVRQDKAAETGAEPSGASAGVPVLQAARAGGTP